MSLIPTEPFFPPTRAAGGPKDPAVPQEPDGPVRTQMVGEAPGEDPGYDPADIPTEPIPDEDDDEDQ